METPSKRIFWLDKFAGEAVGGMYYRASEMVEFIEKVEKKKYVIVGIAFDGTDNIEFITQRKK